MVTLYRIGLIDALGYQHALGTKASRTEAGEAAQRALDAHPWAVAVCIQRQRFWPEERIPRGQPTNPKATVRIVENADDAHGDG